MPIELKAFLRELLPVAAQVPVKYWYNWARGSLEPEMSLLKYLIAKDDRVVDVGGNRGIYAYHCWKLGGIVEVFEPNPVCERVLEAWAHGRHRVTLHAVGLSNQTGATNLHIPMDEAGIEHDASASIEYHAFSHARDQLISLRTLDSYGFNDARFIKIDVEGHEFSVIEGAAETLSRLRPALLVEIEQRHCVRPIDEVFAKVLSHNYRGFFLDNGTLRPLDSFDLERDQAGANFGHGDARYINNFLFLHDARCAGGEYRVLLERFGYK